MGSAQGGQRRFRPAAMRLQKSSSRAGIVGGSDSAGAAMGALNSGVEEFIGSAPVLQLHEACPSLWFSRIDQGLAVLGEYRASPLSRRLRGERHKHCTSILNVHASKLVSN